MSVISVLKINFISFEYYTRTLCSTKFFKLCKWQCEYDHGLQYFISSQLSLIIAVQLLLFLLAKRT